MKNKGRITVFDGERMKEQRNRSGLTQNDLAVKIGGSQNQIKNYERGARVPNSDTLARIAKALGCSADYLLTLSDKPTQQIPSLGSKLALLLDTLPKSEQDKIERVINAMLSSDG